MKLKKVQVTNFRSVEDSGEFDIDNVTCLVGKNEAGKSALLLALAALNPNEATPVPLEKERDYPRRDWVQYEQKHMEKEALVVRTIWELDESEVKQISAKIGEGALVDRSVEVSRCYGSDIEVSAKMNHSAIVKHHLDQFALNAPERSQLRAAKTTDQLIGTLNSLQSPSEKHLRLQQFLDENGSPATRIQDIVIQNLPSFMYVSSYDRMDGAIQIETTLESMQSGAIEFEGHRGSRLFTEFMDYAGVPLDSIIGVSTYETFNARLNAASTNITDQILEYWSQNPDLEVMVTIDNARPNDQPPFNTGTIARARIKNNLHRVDTPFSERSAGFVWFFSFLVKFAQVKKSGRPIVLLLDEPGLSLHGMAQADLLRFIDDKLAPSHQVIYSTHSPFMVPADKLGRVRIVADKVDTTKRPRRSYGTKVSQDMLMVDPETLFPLQGALGYEITQSLFVGKHTLLVEGPGDILYLQALSNALESRGRTKLDPRWTMCPAGGIGKIMPFVSLFSGKGLHIAVLTDLAKGEKRKVKEIKESDILREGHCFTVADFIEAREADIEDIFDPELFAEIVNRCYELPEVHRVTAEKLDQDTTSTRLVKKVEALFNVMPDSIPEFSHFPPAAWLIRNPGMLTGDSDAILRTLLVAERIFETVNGLLK